LTLSWAHNSYLLPRNNSMQDKKILYIEDHPLNAEILRRIIKKIWGQDIDIAETAEEGLSRLEETPYDLIYMDIHLPGITGLEATKLIKNDKTSPTPIIIAVTADASPSAQQEIKEAGGDGFVAKPVDVEILKKTTEALFKE